MKPVHIIRFVVCVLSSGACLAFGRYNKQHGNYAAGLTLYVATLCIWTFNTRQFKAETEKAKALARNDSE